MKNVLLLASLCALPVLTQAQTEKGQGIWTGSLSTHYNSEKNTMYSSQFFNRISQSSITISRGYFFKDNWLVGGGLTAGLNTLRMGVPDSSAPLTDSTTNINTSLSGYVRRYWGKDKWRVFLGGGLSMNYTLQRYGSTRVSNADWNTFAVTPVFQVGANYYITDRIGLEASASSSSYPFSLGGVGIGLVILTGVNSSNSSGSYEAPQTEKGRWLVAGTFNFNTIGMKSTQPMVDDERSNAFTISPAIGWFVKKNLLLGVSVPLALNNTTNGSSFAYGISPQLKKYISDNRLRPFVSGTLLYLANRVKSKLDESKSTNHQASIAVSTGLAYLLGERFIIEAELGGLYFSKRFYPETPNYKTWNGGLSATLQPGFTINYVFD